MASMVLGAQKAQSSYSKAEERANVLSHGLGILFSAVALVLLLFTARRGDGLTIGGAAIFGASLLLLFSASTLYHATVDPDLRRRRRVLDHASIYVLIAGTYTPYCLTSLRGPMGWTILALIWTLALLGVVLSIFFTGKARILAVIGYVAMGWIVVFAIKPLSTLLPVSSFALLFAGGLVYTVGAIVYAIKRIPWNHALWHCFVLGGAFCHFLSVMAAYPR